MTLDPILLVDDEEDLRLFLKDSLVADGFQVEDAPDALSALALMDAKHYAVVLTDLNMPGGPTGFELIKAVTARDPRTLCVVITGFASMETAIQAVKFGAYDFVQKPFKLAEIEAVLNRALNHATVLTQLGDYQTDLEARVLARVQELHDYQEEVLKLNELLVAAQDQLDEGALLQPFLTHLVGRFQPQAHALLLPSAGDGWTLLQHQGPRPWDGTGLPGPSQLRQVQDWASQEGQREGYLVPLLGQDGPLAALYLEFPWRSQFQVEDRVFGFWRQQAVAALHGLARTRALAQRLSQGR